MYMKKMCNFRLEDNLLKELDKLEGTRTFNVTQALQKYLFIETQKQDDKYNVNLIGLYDTRITDLKDRITAQDKEINFLQSQLTAMTVTKNPSLKDWFINLLKPKSEN